MIQSKEAYTESTRRIIESLDCPYQVFTSSQTANEVEEGYKLAAIRGKKEGFTPLLVVSSDILADILESLKKEPSARDTVIQQPEKNAEEMLKEWYEEFIEEYQEMDEEETREAWYSQTGEELVEELGETISEFTSFCISSDNEIEETILLEIPVKNPWEVIAWVPMGGWNECPAADDMMEVCRYWYKKYGAVPALVSTDTLEFVLEQPVSKEESMQAAKEHYAFCTDRVDQGTETGTLAELASCISKSNYWFFWWD